MPAPHPRPYFIDLDWLVEAFDRTRKDGAVGVDGQDGEDYAVDLMGNLQSLLDRAKSRAYRAPPVRLSTSRGRPTTALRSCGPARGGTYPGLIRCPRRAGPAPTRRREGSRKTLSRRRLRLPSVSHTGYFTIVRRLSLTPWGGKRYSFIKIDRECGAFEVNSGPTRGDGRRRWDRGELPISDTTPDPEAGRMIAPSIPVADPIGALTSVGRPAR
jgi:hypothetical protein